MARRQWSYGIAAISIFYLLFYVLPLVGFLWISLQVPSGFAVASGGPTLTSYASVVREPLILRSLLTTLELAVVTATVSALLAYPVAFLIVRSQSAWGTVAFLIVVASMLTNLIVSALGLQVLLMDHGPVNSALLALHVSAEPVRFTNSLAAVVVGLVHGVMPLAVINLIPALDAVPAHLEAAAGGLGATRWRTFWRVTFPLTWRSVLGVWLLTFSIATGAFVTPLLLGGGRVQTIALQIQQLILQLLNYPEGAALSVVLLIVTLALIAAALRLSGARGVRARAQ